VDAAAAQFDEEEDVEPLECNCLDSKEVDREHALRLLPQERPPRQAGTLAGGTDARLAQDLPHGRGGDGQPKSVDLAGDPLVAPARILAREPEDELADLAAERRSARPAGVVQRRATSPRCHRSSVLGVTKNEPQRERGSSRLAAASRSRSLGRNCGRPACRRSTDNSCRRTTISSSLKPSDRARRSTICSKQRNAR
jgi:hypothetical protein